MVDERDPGSAKLLPSISAVSTSASLMTTSVALLGVKFNPHTGHRDALNEIIAPAHEKVSTHHSNGGFNHGFNMHHIFYSQLLQAYVVLKLKCKYREL